MTISHSPARSVTAPRRGRAQAGALLGASLLAAVLAACGGGSGKIAEVTADIAAQLQSVGLPADGKSVDCADKLTAEVGKTVTCSFTSDDGQPVDAVAVAISVDGDQVGLDLTTEAQPVPKDVLAKSVSDRVAEEAGVDITSSTCADELKAEVGQSTACDLAAGTDTRTMKVTVLSIDGGLINYGVDGV